MSFASARRSVSSTWFMISRQVAWEDEVLDVGPEDLDAVARRRALHVVPHRVRDLVPVAEDRLEVAVGEEPTGGELDVLVDPLLYQATWCAAAAASCTMK